MKNLTVAVIITALLHVFLFGIAGGMDGVQFAGPNGVLIKAFAYRDGSSLMIMADSIGEMGYRVNVVWLDPDGAATVDQFVTPPSTNLDSIIVKVCRENIQVFGQADRAWRYVSDSPFEINEVRLPLICQ